MLCRGAGRAGVVWVGEVESVLAVMAGAGAASLA